MATYEIIIRRPPAEGNTDGISPAPVGNIATQKGGSVIPENQVGRTVQAAATKVASQTIQSVVQVYTANKTTEINVLSGSMQLAQRQQVVNSVISSASNVATSALSGAGMGAMIGGAPGAIGGAIAGAITGALTKAISEATGYAIRKDQLNIERTAEQQEIGYLQNRAGPFFNQSR